MEVNAFYDTTNKWSRVQERHGNYTEPLEVEDPVNEAWITTEQEKYNSLQKKYFDYK